MTYQYSDYSYDSEGRRDGYTMSEIDAVGSVIKSFTVAESPGAVTGGGYQGATVIETDAGGIKTGSKEYSAYSYDEAGTGKLTGFQLVDRDAAGNLKEKQVYTADAFDDLGLHSAYTQKNYVPGEDPDTEILDSTVSYTEVSYYKSGQAGPGPANISTSGYKFIKTDKDGEFLESYRYSDIKYDASGNKATYHWVQYAENGVTILDEGDYPPPEAP